MSAKLTGGVPSQKQPYLAPSEQAKVATSPEVQYSFMPLILAQTSVQPSTNSLGGTGLPNFFLVANISLHASAEKPAPLTVAVVFAVACAMHNRTTRAWHRGYMAASLAMGPFGSNL